MVNTERYENYPLRLVALSNVFSLSIYAIGATILWGFTPLASALYLAYCAILEIRILRHSCPHCYYYGKACCFGKGRLCSLLSQKGDPKKFIEKQVSWFDILPDFMVTIIPVLGGIILLVSAFSWVILALVLVLLLLGFPGSAFIRGSYACKYCRQRELGCPALSLFEKKRSENLDEQGSVQKSLAGERAEPDDPSRIRRQVCMPGFSSLSVRSLEMR